MKDICDILVIGAGPSGAVASALLNKFGHKVVVVEKQNFPRFVIGESLLPKCMEGLDEAGLLDCIKDSGFQEKFGAKFIKGSQTCDFNFGDNFTEGWTWTWQVPRGDFDNVLASEIQKQGVSVNFNKEVIAIEKKQEGWTVEILDENGKTNTISCKYIVDGSGYGKVLPRLLNLEIESGLKSRKSVFAHIKDDMRPNTEEANQIIIICHKGFWIWIIPFSNGYTSIGFVGEEEEFEPFIENGEVNFDLLISDHPFTKQRFAQADYSFEPKSLQGYSFSVKEQFGDGYVLIGNNSGFLDPVFSSGVTFAVESGRKAAHLLNKQINGEAVNWEKDYSEYLNTGLSTFKAYVDGWYNGDLQTIFFNDAVEPDPLIKKQITSVLAGYVWDENNPFVKKPVKIIEKLSKFLRFQGAN